MTRKNSRDDSDVADYGKVDLPDPEEVAYEDWNVQERRAWLYREVRRLGVPSAVHQGETGEQFDVDQSTISRDLDKVREAIISHEDGKRFSATAAVIYERAVEKLMDEGEYMKAVRATDSWMEWMQSSGKIEKTAEKRKVAIQQAETETDAMRLVNEDGTPLSESEEGW